MSAHCEICGALLPESESANHCAACALLLKKQNRNKLNRSRSVVPKRKIGSTKICKSCNREFTITKIRQLRCDECIENKRIKKAPMRTCIWCKNPFSPKYNTEKLCSDECRKNKKKSDQFEVYHRLKTESKHISFYLDKELSQKASEKYGATSAINARAKELLAADLENGSAE